MRNKVLAAEPTSKRLREENRERVFLAASPPKPYFARAYDTTSTQATFIVEVKLKYQYSVFVFNLQGSPVALAVQKHLSRLLELRQ